MKPKTLYKKLMKKSTIIEASYNGYAVRVGVAFFPGVKALNEYLVKWTSCHVAGFGVFWKYRACFIRDKGQKKTQPSGIICLPEEFSPGILAHEAFHAVSHSLKNKDVEEEIIAKLLGRLIDDFHAKGVCDVQDIIQGGVRSISVGLYPHIWLVVAKRYPSAW